jgi:Ca-activated chloride channel homolog
MISSDSQATSRCFSQRADRRGAILVLFGILIVVIFGMVAFAVDVAYMQLVRAELRAATDAAAKAGALELRLTDGNGAAARTAAINIAARNTVGGKALTLNGSEIELGRSVYQGDGTYRFVANQTPYTSVRVNSNLTANSAMGNVRLFFGNMLGRPTFEPQQVATASQLQQEIVLCLDRSGSMCFDLTGIDYSYPLGRNGNRPPHLTLSRWAALETAVDVFLDILASQRTQPRVGLVTWSAADNLIPAATRDSPMTLNYATIAAAVDARFLTNMTGATNMAAGIDEAVKQLTEPGISTLATRTVVLMTDGDWNEGRDPIAAANDAAAAGVTIHTIGFLNNDQATLQQIAMITGGEYIYATNQADLEAAFRKIARMLPVALTE